MRLFIALNFNNEVKDKIGNIINKVKSNAIHGKFTEGEHLHLTLEFLGKVQKNRVDLIKDVMNDLDFHPFKLKLTKTGFFKRREGNIYWLGIEKNLALINMHRELHQRLMDEGFKLEYREY